MKSIPPNFSSRNMVKEHGCGVRDDPCNIFVDSRPPLKIVVKGFKNDLLTGNPLLDRCPQDCG